MPVAFTSSGMESSPEGFKRTEPTPADRPKEELEESYSRETILSSAKVASFISQTVVPGGAVKLVLAARPDMTSSDALHLVKL